MEDIVNFNCDGLCIQKHCDQKYTKYTNQKINGMEIGLAFCEKHADEFTEGAI